LMSPQTGAMLCVFAFPFFSVGLAAFFVLIYFCNCSTQHHAFFNRLL
jgi:hypothetical protein